MVMDIHLASKIRLVVILGMHYHSHLKIIKGGSYRIITCCNSFFVCCTTVITLIYSSRRDKFEMSSTVKFVSGTTQ